MTCCAERPKHYCQQRARLRQPGVCARLCVARPSFRDRLKLSNLAEQVQSLCGVKLQVLSGWVQPPSTLPADAAGHLEYEGRAASITLATTPSSICKVTPPPLILGSTCYAPTSCNLNNIFCPNNGHLSTDLSTYCTCSLPCNDPSQVCSCSVTLADLNLVNQCPATEPVLSGCYCINSNHTQVTRFGTSDFTSQLAEIANEQGEVACARARFLSTLQTCSASSSTPSQASCMSPWSLTACAA